MVVCCENCHQPYPETGFPFRCPACGGMYDYAQPPVFDSSRVDSSQPGMWRYRHTFDLPADAPVTYLGEGMTPLIRFAISGTQVGLKMESQNPTGYYKDRGSAVLVSKLISRGVKLAVEDSSGNAGASFAAYAGCGGVKARIYIPENAAGPKRLQIERQGAELVRVAGPRSEAARAVLQDAESGIPYASHACIPFGLTGIATMAYEIWETLQSAPGSVIAPVGHGGLLLGIMRGFQSLKNAGLITETPFYVGVQAANCSPMVEAYEHGKLELNQYTEGWTLAEGVRVSKPARGKALLQEMDHGTFIAIPEEEILPAFYELARKGLYVEPTAALGWSALVKLIHQLVEPIIVVLTGSGLKYI